MSIRMMLKAAKGAKIVGSVLHGAYGDYYEQMVCLREFKRLRPDVRLILFYETESRRREMAVFDTSFAEDNLPAEALNSVRVDAFVQFQILDQELKEVVFDKLKPEVLAQFDFKHNLKPWTTIRKIFRTPGSCDVGLSELGRQRLPEVMARNGVDPAIFDRQMTVGFLWRYRRPGGPISSYRQPPQEVVIRTKSELLTRFAKDYGAKILVGGMNVETTDENRERTDNKFTDKRLAIPEESAIYLKGLSWGLELEIMKRCSLCIVMASGFSEALLMKRTHGEPTVLVDPPLLYTVKLWWNRMPLFHPMRPGNAWFYLRQPHTEARAMKYMRRRGMLPKIVESVPEAALAGAAT